MVAMDWNTLASSSYGAVGLLAQERYDRSTVSRAYYAAYSRIAHMLALCGMTFADGREGPGHEKLDEVVLRHLRMLGQHRWLVAEDLRTLYKMRLEADYRPSRPIEAMAARKAVRLMSRIFSLTKGVVDE